MYLLDLEERLHVICGTVTDTKLRKRESFSVLYIYAH